MKLYRRCYSVQYNEEAIERYGQEAVKKDLKEKIKFKVLDEPFVVKKVKGELIKIAWEVRKQMKSNEKEYSSLGSILTRMESTAELKAMESFIDRLNRRIKQIKVNGRNWSQG